ncbi:MAG: pyridoxal phosphate-dependent aminotransferase [Oscillospiraceae bacterium]|nr:pyridoxal phosphate-dependent aminotransferase [Oscillospiraceae bacterium]
MKYDFTTLNTGGVVHPFVAEQGITDPGIISYSVAEMRLNLAPEITKAMHEIVDVGCFGYAPPAKERYDAAVRSWMKTRHNWDVSMDWAVQTYGVVTAMGIALRVMTQPGDGVIIQTPVYPPFANTVKNNGRKLLTNPLKSENGVYTMDFADLEEKAKEAKVLMLCSPHNPVGRVWTREELRMVGEICLKYGLYVVSDEIHCDLDYQGRHLMFLQVNPELADRTVICTAPSKTFNLAGNAQSNIFIPGKDLREKFSADASLHCGHYLGTFAYASTTAAYEHGAQWLDELLVVLQENRRVLMEGLTKLIPGAVFSPLEGTYLQWIDLSCLGLSQEALMNKLAEAKVFVNDGTTFGEGAEGHIRFNLACPTRCIKEALDRLSAVL